MSGLFHDTLFAAIVRVVLGPTYFPHLDEIGPPNIYQKSIRRVKSSDTTIIGTKDKDDSRGGSFATPSELEAQTTRSVALQSSLTSGRGVEDHDNLPNARGRRLEAFDEQGLGSHATQSVALQTSLTLRPLAEDQDKPLSVPGHGFGALDEREAHTTQPMAPQSSLTVVVPEEPKSLKEEGTNSLLVTWNGPDDPEVS
jgi:hypothetical protein